MQLSKSGPSHSDVSKSISIVLTILVLLGSATTANASAYSSLMMETQATIFSPVVILQNGTAGTSTIGPGNTSAEVSVSAPRENDTEDFIDLMSDIDDSADIGTHSNFTAQQYGPDLINDTLTEQDTGIQLIIRPNAAGKKSDWNPVGSTNNWECVDEVTPDEDTTFVNISAKSKKDFYNLQDHTTETGSISNVRLTARAKGNAGSELNLRIIVGDIEYQGTTRTLTTSYADYYDDWATNPAGGNWDWSAIDAMEAGFVASKSNAVEHRVTQLYVTVTYGTNYELDLEVQWTSVDYNETSEYLCIYGGTMESENITVAAWNGTAWNNLLADLSSGWNNVSVSTFLTSSNFTVRFKGGNETNDVTQDSWSIDAAFLHTCTFTETTYDYILRVNNTATDAWEIRLKKYSDSGVSRLQNCTIHFHNLTDGTSAQIVVENGSFESETGPWYDLGNLETIYIAITVEANNMGTAYVDTYLEIRAPSATTYVQYEIAYEIT